MKRLLACSLLFLFLFSCTERESKGKFKISGELKHAEDQKIFLDQLYFSQQSPEVLDTGEIKNGRFTLSALAPEEGLFRLRLEKSNAGFLFINDKPSIDFSADLHDVSLQGPSFNSPANRQLKNFLVELEKRRMEITQTNEILENLKTTKNNDTAVSLQSEKINQLNEALKNYIIKFIDTTSNPIIAMFALGFTRDVEPERLNQVVPNLTRRFPEHQGVASLVTQYNQMIAMQNQNPKTSIPGPGSMAPDITLNDTNGVPYSLSSLRGKYVLVDFWASWCGPCRRENPNLVDAYNKFNGKNFTILGVSLDDDKASWLKAIKDDNLSWKQISDLKQWSSAAVGLYGFDGIPYNVLVDPEGKIIATSLRGGDLHNKLMEILK